MKIASNTISMSSSHVLSTEQNESESLKVWSDNRNASKSLELEINQLRIDDDVSTEVLQTQSSASRQTNQSNYALYQISDRDKLKIKLIEAFMTQMTGKKFHIRFPSEIKVETQGMARTQDTSQPNQRAGWGLIYTKDATISQHEETSFHASASVKTIDGKQIDLNISMFLQRKEEYSERTTILAGDALVDPLVMNFGGASASMSDKKISFDINCDGSEEQITFLNSSSGFLALDKNNNGTIDDGSELFGTKSGDGFQDLAAYDQDGNGWIDENDEIFDSLQIWSKDDGGNDILVGLGEKGIGAIYLGSAATEFSMNRMGELDAQIRRTGFYLNENGSGGTIQHIDFAI